LGPWLLLLLLLLLAWSRYYCVVPLSLLPSSWYKQQQWQQLQGGQQAMECLAQSLQMLPARLSALQLLVGGR
jgi:hypothetical protein